MTDDRGMPPVLVYSAWRPPKVTVRRQVLFAAVGMFAGGAAGCALLFCAAGMAGAGHGSYGPAKLFFPYSMALTRATESITTPLIVLAAAQYPSYGLLVGWLHARNRGRLGWLLLLGIHACALAAGMALASGSFSP